MHQRQFSLGDIEYRATIVDDQYVDHHPFLNSGSFEFARGNSNNSDATVDIADTIYTLNYLFANGRAPDCEDAADANNDGRLDIADPIYVFNFLFGSGPPLAPWPECGFDTDIDDLVCIDPLCP